MAKKKKETENVDEIFQTETVEETPSTEESTGSVKGY